jgi:hypothetical protein
MASQLAVLGGLRNLGGKPYPSAVVNVRRS